MNATNENQKNTIPAYTKEQTKSISGIKCVMNDQPSLIKLSYTSFSILKQDHPQNIIENEYDRLVNIQTKNKNIFYLKVILMKHGYDIDITNKSKHTSIIISFTNVDSRDLVKNILFVFLNMNLNQKTEKSNEVFDYTVFLKLPVLQNIFETSNMSLSKFIEILLTSKVYGSSNTETIIDKLITQDMNSSISTLSNRINYMSQTIYDSIKETETNRKVIIKELQIDESTIIKDLNVGEQMLYDTNFKDLKYEISPTDIDTDIRYPKLNTEKKSYKNNKRIEMLLKLSKRCYNEKISENEMREIIQMEKSLNDLNKDLIKHVKPTTFLSNPLSVNHEMYKNMK